MTSLYQLSLAIVVLTTERLFASEGRYPARGSEGEVAYHYDKADKGDTRRVGARALVPFGFAAAGVARVIFAQASEFGGVDFGGAAVGFAIGVALALLAAALDDTSGVGFRRGADVAAILPQELRGGKDAEHTRTLVGICRYSLIGGVSWSAMGFMSGGAN